MRVSISQLLSADEEERALARWLDAHDFDLIASSAERERMLLTGRREIAARTRAIATS